MDEATLAPLKAALVASWHEGAALVAGQPLLGLALIAMALVLVGSWLRRPLPMFAGFLRFCGNLGLIGAMLATMAAAAHFTFGDHLPLPGAADQPAGGDQQISGGEARIRMASDGHFWVRARINGVSRRFLVDTGATLTTLSPEAADAAQVRPKRWGEKLRLNTANGPIEAPLAVIDRLEVGHIRADTLDAVVAPGLGNTNVLGMNFLSRLAGWRVEDNVLILTARRAR